MPADNALNRHRFHPLQLERMELENNYSKKREELDTEYKKAMREIQNTCTHKWEDGRSAEDYTTPPFSEKFCLICKKEEW